MSPRYRRASEHEGAASRWGAAIICAMTAPFFFVVNPAAGSGRADTAWLDVMRAARASGLIFEYETTQGPLTATSFTRQALRAGAETVVAVGGDGTINEVVNGFFLDGALVRPGSSLGLIPLGSSSDIARSLGIPGGAGGLDILIHGRPLPVDVGHADLEDGAGRSFAYYFVNDAAVGVGARIAAGRSPLDRVGGRAAVFLSSLDVLTKPSPWTGTLQIDDGDAQEVCAVTVVAALGPYTGGGMHIAPGAKIDDGLFDVVVIDAMSSAELIANLPRIYAGAHLSHPKVHVHRARTVHIATEDRPPIELDGEVVGVGGATFNVLPGTLPVYLSRP
ncbi:MAG: uncharacterized protein HW416_2278 [Chloroflexi bacterium]|nr:uncharacterized protein [Chloroflexota bacterium]